VRASGRECRSASGRGTSLTAFIGVLAVLAGCGTATPSGPVATLTSVASAGPKTAASLTIAIPDDPGSALNIWIANQAFDPLVDLVYDKLLAPSPYTDDLQPGLAESVTQVDPSTWDVTVRSGVTWQDGQPFTADDVKFTYEYFRDGVPNRYTHHTNDAPDIESIEATGDRTLRFHCAYPCPELGPVTFADLPILPRHIWGSVTEPAKFSGLPIGTGPYRLVEYAGGQFLRFEANDAYFLGRPTVAELVFAISRDQDATFAALQSGEIGIAARSVPPELLPDLAARPGIKVVSTTPLTAVMVRLNYQRPPFDEPRFRQAFSLAIDRQALVDTILLGDGRPGTRGYPHPDSPWTNPDLATPYDPARAGRLLDELGYRDTDGDGIREGPGGPISVDIQVSASEPTQVRAAELLVGQLKAVGVDVSVRTTDAATIRSLFRSRDFDVMIEQGFAHELADPDQFIESSRSGLAWSKDLPYPEWDRLVAQWKQATDLASRKAILFQLQALFNSQPTVIPLWYPYESWAFRPAAYDGWSESRGYGIVNKWSFLPADARSGKIVQTFD
jgi:peptide/nickel transport system substrate-binding protein